MKMIKSLTVLTALALSACTGMTSSTSTSSSSGGATASCDNNVGNGTAMPTAFKELTLGTKLTGKACYDSSVSGTQYYYWQATGTYTTADTFTAVLKGLNMTSTETITTCFGDATATFAQCEYGPSASSTTPEATDNDISPIDTDGSKLTVLVSVTSTDNIGTDKTTGDVSFELTVTKNAANP